MNRYSRHIILEEIGAHGQKKLNQAKVLVVGAGGLGCPVLQYLAAAGVGTIGIIDHDVVEESNLQRQILYGTSNLGQSKAIVAKQRLLDLNDTIIIEAFVEMLTHKNAISHFLNYDIIVDGTDNFATRYLINDAAVIANKPVVYGAIYKFEGQVSVFNYKNGPNYRCLFPNPPSKNDIPNCAEVGVLGVLPGIIGSMQANEVLKIILGFKNVLSGKLFCYNSKTTKSFTISIEKQSNTKLKDIEKIKTNFQNQSIDQICDTIVAKTTIEDAIKKKNSLFIDVRESHELPKAEHLVHTNIPLSLLENELSSIDKTKTIILFCQSGIRSATAASIMLKHNFTNCYSLENGIEAIQNYFKINA
ncbi:HesA/MoeB/ThiF family protein [uncultured Psychroserpens sp.]|uniref:HesA/MoeB/ThiF family protein n=1 Tax=uncultured Psychroserpens sp. TaxID=255436 RepID=UPI002619DE9D|nr:HesA/MoeB/ThiF family protein [uncultured Psychroserpens sp.]